MTIENLKQIAIKYATTKGSRVPLAPDELCNAVVQYMNSFFSVMTDINTIKVAVTENSGNIVFTITGNTYDGKPITPIVITVDHNDFVTDQEFEEFKTNILDSIDSLNNSITEINNTIKNINDTLENNTTDITGLKNRVDNTETNISEINSTLNNKLDKVSSTTGVPQVYVKEYNGTQTMIDLSESTRVNSIPKRSPSGRMYTNDGIISEPSSVANMSNIADVESKIPDVSNFATKDEIPDVSGFATKSELTEQLNNKRSVISSPASSYVVYTQANGLESNLPYSELANQTSTNIMARRANGTSDVKKGISGENVANMENIADVEAKIPSITNLADVTKENTFTGENTFNNSIYAKNGIVAGDTTNYGANSVTKGSNTYSFPNKSGTFAMTNDIINEPIYFISFNANAPSEPCHLIGTIMSKNSYGTGQKTNEEFAVMLADNFYTNSNEGLAVYGRLANKDILCIYSEDGLSIRCLDEENSEVDLPTIMFFVMETEL